MYLMLTSHVCMDVANTILCLIVTTPHFYKTDKNNSLKKKRFVRTETGIKKLRAVGLLATLHGQPPIMVDCRYMLSGYHS